MFAQIDANKGSIAGSVTDAAGSPIPEAKVYAIHASSGLQRETLTSQGGQYRIGSLDPGEYDVRVETGSLAAIVRQVTVRVGSSMQVNVAVTTQASPAVVDVSASALSVADSDITEVIALEAIRDLPINGRRFQDFATLAPTVQTSPETLGQLSFVGQRGINSNVMIDGTDYNEPWFGGIRGGDRSNFAFTIPQSAVQEFQTVPSGYSAEFGHSSGGILNTVTRSGTNGTHGEAFYLMRDDALASVNPLGQNYLERQQQFGGAFGGPVLPKRLFLFGAAEQQFARFPRQTTFSALNNIRVTPDIAPAYNYFRSLEAPFKQTNDVTAALVRADYLFSNANSLAARYQFSRNTADNAASTGGSLEPLTNSAISNNGQERDRVQAVSGQLTSALGTWLNEVRVQFSPELRRRIPNAQSVLVQAGTIGSFGTTPYLPAQARSRRFQVVDGLTLLRGAHTVKMGFDYSRLSFYQWYGDNQFGAFLISNPDVSQVLRVLSGGTAGNRFDDGSVVYRRQVGNLEREMAAHQVAFFLQDSWRPARDLIVNAGVRWEAQVNPSPLTNNAFLVTNVRDFTFPLGRVDPTKLTNQFGQWAPRIGIAWSPGQGKTVFRAQTGLFYAQTPFVLLSSAIDNFSLSPADLTLQISPSGSGSVYNQFRAAGFDLNGYNLSQLPTFTVPDVWMKVAGQPNPYAQANLVTTSADNFRNPRAAQVMLAVEHRVNANLSFDYQMNYVNTVHLTRNVDYNVPRPFVRPGDASQRPFFGLRSGTSRPNPNIGQLLVRDSNARSRYTGQTLRAKWQSRQVELGVNYTLGYNKSDDDSERDLTGITYQNPFDLRREYNWSSLDTRHLAAGYILYRGPWGMDFTSLFHYRSGLPIDASAGGDTSELLSSSRGNRPLERPGVPILRNAFRNLDYKSIDLRVLKSFRVTETLRLQLSGELFNLFNFDNVAFLTPSVLPDNPAFNYGPGILQNGQVAPINPGFLKLRTADGAYNPAVAGQQGTPLQAQIGARLIF